jgi:hypothetical protein
LISLISSVSFFHLFFLLLSRLEETMLAPVHLAETTVVLLATRLGRDDVVD